MKRLAIPLTWILLLPFMLLALTNASQDNDADFGRLHSFKKSGFDAPSVYNFSGK